MEVSCVLIEESMRDDFEDVFPSELDLSDTAHNKGAIACEVFGEKPSQYMSNLETCSREK